MENISLLEPQDKLQDINGNQRKGQPYFIIIQKSENKKIRIPCVNEKVAEKLLLMINRQ